MAEKKKEVDKDLLAPRTNSQLHDQSPVTYLENFTILLLLRAIRLRKELKISIGIEKADKFGDVAMYTEENGTKHHQLLHISWMNRPVNQRRILISSLTSKHNPFYLIKYFKAFRKIKTEFTGIGNELSDLVICTNGRLLWHVTQKKLGTPLRIKDSFHGKRNGTFSKKGGNVLGSTVLCFKNDGSIRNLWARFLKENVEMEDDDLEHDIETFLDRIRLSDCLPEVMEIKEMIFKELSLLGVEPLHVCDAYSFLLEKVLQCGKGGQKYHLNSVDGSLMIDMFKKREEVIIFGVEEAVENFTGRSVEFEQIISGYKNNNELQMMITGIGGIGKTELAKKFATEWISAFHCVLWMKGDCMKGLIDSFKNLAFQKLSIAEIGEDGEVKDFNIILQEINQHLERRKCLLILDNVIPKGKDYERSYLKNFISLLSFKPFLLMTSRHEPWEGVSVLPLKELNKEDAVEMVKEFPQGEKNQQKKALSILKLLHYYPLALKLALPCINTNPSSYAKTLERTTNKLSTYKENIPNKNDFMISTMATLEIIMEELKGQKVDLVEECLKIISFMNPDEISVHKLICCFEDKLEGKIRICLKSFHRYGIVNYTAEKLKMNDVLQLLVRCRMSKEDEIEVLEKILKAESLMNMNYEMFTWENVCKHKELMIKYSHIPALVLKCLKEEEKYEEGYEFGSKNIKLLSEYLHVTDKNLLDVIEQLADITSRYEKKSETLKFCKDALIKQKRSHENECTEIMFIRKIDPSLLSEIEKYDDSISIYQEIHGHLEKNIPKSDLTVLQNRCDIALNLTKLGKNEENESSPHGIYSCLKNSQEDVESLNTKRQAAEVFLESRNYEESLVIFRGVYAGFKRVLGAKHLESLRTQLSIAMILSILGEKSESLAMYLTINASLKEVVGDDHRDIIRTSQSIVSLLNELGRYEESLRVSKKLYYTSVRVLGERDAITLKIGQAHALSLGKLGKLEESLLKFKEILPSMKQVLGEDDPSTINTGINIANLLFELRKFKESHEFYRKCYPISKRSLGETHPDTLDSGWKFVETFIELGKYKEGHELCNEIYICCYRILGSEHPDTLRSGCRVALILEKLGRSKESLAVLEEQCGRMKNVFGDNHLETLNARCNIASVLNVLGNHEESFIFYEEVCSSKQMLFGDEHPEVFSVKCKIAACLYEMGKYKESLFKYVELFLIMQKVLGEENMDVLKVKCSIAFTFSELGMYSPSLDMYKEVYMQVKRLLGEEDPRTLCVKTDMALTEEKLNYPGKSYSTLVDIYAIMKNVLGDDHPLTINAHGYVSDALVSLGNCNAGLDILYEMKNRLGNVLGEEHHETLRVLSKIAKTFGEMNRMEDSLTLFAEVCSLMRKNLCDGHKVSLKARSDMSHILRSYGRYEESLSLSREIYQIMMKILGKEHPETLNTMNDIAVTLCKQKKFEDSLRVYNEVYHGMKAVFGEENLFTISCKEKMDSILQKVKKT